MRPSVCRTSISERANAQYRAAVTTEPSAGSEGFRRSMTAKPSPSRARLLSVGSWSGLGPGTARRRRVQIIGCTTIGGDRVPCVPARPARPSAWSKWPWLRTTAWIWDRSSPRLDHRPGHHRVAAPACGDRRAQAPRSRRRSAHHRRAVDPFRRERGRRHSGPVAEPIRIPSSSCDPWQTYSLEGGPEDPLGRRQRAGARQLATSPAGDWPPALATGRCERDGHNGRSTHDH